MKEIGREVQAANGHPSPANGTAALPAASSAVPNASAASAVPRDEPLALPTRSRLGPAGVFAKRVVERLLRFYTLRQAVVDADLTARLQRVEAELAQVAGVRRDLAGAALDFGAIADRMSAFENVRRVVERSAAFRYEVRAHRRALAELRAQVAALSVRLTLVQRESAPVRAAFEGIRGEIDALHTRYARLTVRAGDADAAVESTAERVAGLARDAEDREAAVDQAETRIAALQTEIEHLGSATSRDLAQRSTELRAVVEEVERRLSATAEQLSALVEARGGATERALEALRGTLAANHAALRAGLEERIERAQRIGATLRTAFDLFEREAAAQRDGAAEQSARLDAHDGRAAAIQQRLADVAGALNAIRDGARAEQAAAAQRLQDALGAVRAEVAAERGPELEPVQADLVRLAGEFELLRARLLATPYMTAPVESWPTLRRSTADDFDYVGFEDVFRGSEAFIRERQRVYLPLLEGRAPVLELGSGRGEFLDLLRECGIAASGVDMNPSTARRAHAKGLDNLVIADANAYLTGLAESSLGAIFSAQFVEHLTFSDLLRCLELSRTRLVPGGLFIAETVNPNSIEAWKTFYVDLSHHKPLFPEVFVFLCRSMGFSEVRVFYPNGGGFDAAVPTDQHEYAIVATAPSREGSKTAALPSSRSGPPRRRRARRHE